MPDFKFTFVTSPGDQGLSDQSSPPSSAPPKFSSDRSRVVLALEWVLGGLLGSWGLAFMLVLVPWGVGEEVCSSPSPQVIELQCRLRGVVVHRFATQRPVPPALPMPAYQLPAPSSEVYRVRQGGTLLRRAADVRTNPVRVLDPTDFLTINRASEDGVWLQVRVQATDQIGFVRRDEITSAGR